MKNSSTQCIENTGNISAAASFTRERQTRARAACIYTRRCIYPLHARITKESRAMQRFRGEIDWVWGARVGRELRLNFEVVPLLRIRGYLIVVCFDAPLVEAKSGEYFSEE